MVPKKVQHEMKGTTAGDLTDHSIQTKTLFIGFSAKIGI